MGKSQNNTRNVAGPLIQKPYQMYPNQPHPGFVPLLLNEHPLLAGRYLRALIEYQKAIHTATENLAEKVRKIMIEIDYP